MGILSDSNIIYIEDLEEKTTRDFTNIKLYGRNTVTKKDWCFNPSILRNVTEWEAGIYSINPTLVTHSGNLYVCKATLPFTSSNFATELYAKKWAKISNTSGYGAYNPSVYVSGATITYSSYIQYTYSERIVTLVGYVVIKTISGTISFMSINDIPTEIIPFSTQKSLGLVQLYGHGSAVLSPHVELDDDNGEIRFMRLDANGNEAFLCPDTNGEIIRFSLTYMKY